MYTVAIGANPSQEFVARLIEKAEMESVLTIGEIYGFNFSTSNFHLDGRRKLGIVINHLAYLGEDILFMEQA